MSAPIVVPFNYNPTSNTAFNNTSYTIPAGRYAYVTASCRDGGTFTIGGVAALESSPTVAGQLTISAGVNTGANTTTDFEYTVPTGESVEILAVGTNQTQDTSNNALYAYSTDISASGSRGIRLTGNLVPTNMVTNLFSAGAPRILPSGATLIIPHTASSILSTHKRLRLTRHRPVYPSVTDAPTSGSYWLRTGTVISGSGNRNFAVSLFNIIS